MSTTNALEKAKPPKKLKVVDDKILKQTYFIPKQKMQKFLDKLEERYNKVPIRCSYNLQKLQESRLGSDSQRFNKLWSTRNRRALFVFSCHKSLYAHDWNKLLYLLKKVPYTKLCSHLRNSMHFSLYPRLQMLLLMFHPTSHETGALNDFFHMAWGCRTESEKKAILKVLLTLRKKIPLKIKICKRAIENEPKNGV